MKLEMVMTRKLFYYAITIIFALVLVGCVTGKQKLLDSGMQPLKQTDFDDLFSKDIKANYLNSNGHNVSVQFYPDGTQKYSSPKNSDIGKWSIKNNEQCSTWSNLRNGQEKCFTWFKISENKYELFEQNGNKAGTITIK